MPASWLCSGSTALPLPTLAPFLPQPTQALRDAAIGLLHPQKGRCYVQAHPLADSAGSRRFAGKDRELQLFLRSAALLLQRSLCRPPQPLLRLQSLCRDLLKPVARFFQTGAALLRAALYRLLTRGGRRYCNSFRGKPAISRFDWLFAACRRFAAAIATAVGAGHIRLSGGKFILLSGLIGSACPLTAGPHNKDPRDPAMNLLAPYAKGSAPSVSTGASPPQPLLCLTSF